MTANTVLSRTAGLIKMIMTVVMTNDECMCVLNVNWCSGCKNEAEDQRGANADNSYRKSSADSDPGAGDNST